uniref:Alkaline phosphatase D family protein n=1 Tax=Roseihalotalea indica TaxID=2867963 RepID=A0AA49GT64_9BACT|nr:alkaline phosphatase D family protein [Tunicatimonas sp. TK19036]
MLNLLLYLFIYLISTCSAFAQSPIHTGQGIMAGEVTATSVILQTRLTTSDTLIDNDLPGASGIACFELATDSSFTNAFRTTWQQSVPSCDYIVKIPVTGLQPYQRYYYRALYGTDPSSAEKTRIGTFRTLADTLAVDSVSMVIVTGMNFRRFHYGREQDNIGYQGPDKDLGYPALATITRMQPDFFISTGDNLYYDHPPPGMDTAQTVATMRQHWHWQLEQPRYRQLFAKVPTYWEKDDHDYRWNDADTAMVGLPTHEDGIRLFKEQFPIVDPNDLNPITYRTYRLNRDVQIWLIEGRDYRSPNEMPDGPQKSIWGEAQKQWLKRTLLESDATYKLMISPTPMVGPDDAYKNDNHANPKGFRHEGDEFFAWLQEHQLLDKNFYIICGDRHWQYHAINPDGIEEFSTGALVDGNSRLGRKAGDPESTDPEGLIQQPYLQPEASGGFLKVTITPQTQGVQATFTHYDENGVILYEHQKMAQ